MNSILIKPSNTTKCVSLLSLLYIFNKDNRDTYFVVFDGFISILQLLHNGMENAKTTVKFVASQAKSIRHYKSLRSSNKDNKDTYFVVFDGFISILQLLHNGMENAKTTVKFVASQAKSIHHYKSLRSSNKDNKDTYFVVFDGFISIL